MELLLMCRHLQFNDMHTMINFMVLNLLNRNFEERFLQNVVVLLHLLHVARPPLKSSRFALQCSSIVFTISVCVIRSTENARTGGHPIRPSNSPWSSLLVMVEKKDGSWRVCVDFRRVNAVTHRDAYPLSRIDATLDSLSGSCYFTTVDRYWQVELEESDKEKTAFLTPGEFNVMPFRLTKVNQVCPRWSDSLAKPHLY